MSTEILYLTGTCKWAKVKKPDPEYDNYSIDFYPDEKSMKALTDSGIQISEKQDEDGVFFKLRRKAQQIIKGEMVNFGPPTVMDKENKPFDGLIGNGSGVTVKVAVFDTRKGKGHRWEAVRVENLVEYVPVDEDGNPKPKSIGFIPPFSGDTADGKKGVTAKRSPSKATPPF